jgi:hypothetical protein
MTRDRSSLVNAAAKNILAAGRAAAATLRVFSG